ncbi:hypothetical protein [Desulfofundulus luciae]|uniref:hypothetical protein n=1 Tax=Desulfofundulus luciae TaxID=74702 RepID=UPI0027D78D2F|nr:hypothetical protein [Desulfofundulus luciae]
MALSWFGKGCAKLGYLAAGHAAVVAPVLDRLGGKLRGNLEAITGGNGRRYGVNISLPWQLIPAGRLNGRPLT